MTDEKRPVAVVLAGGLATRMGGGDKALLRLAGKPLLDHILGRIGPQVTAIALNANGDPARFAAWALPVLADPLPGALGPLAGVLAGLRWARQAHPGSELLLSVPGDTPFLPPDLVARLLAARGGGAPIACAESLGRRHPVVALWPVALAGDLAAALAEGVRGVERYAARHGLASAAFPGDPFVNINTPEDLRAAAEQAG